MSKSAPVAEMLQQSEIIDLSDYDEVGEASANWNIPGQSARGNKQCKNNLALLLVSPFPYIRL